MSILGGSGGVVNSLDICPASLKYLGCFYFRCVLSSQWKAVTVNLRIFSQLWRHFWRPVVRVCLLLQDASKCIFSTNSRSSGQPKNNANTILFPPYIPFPGNFCNCHSGGICTASQFQVQLSLLYTAWTLRASLSGTFLQTLPDLVTQLKRQSLSPRSCPPTRSAPSERFRYW